MQTFPEEFTERVIEFLDSRSAGNRAWVRTKDIVEALPNHFPTGIPKRDKEQTVAGALVQLATDGRIVWTTSVKNEIFHRVASARKFWEGRRFAVAISPPELHEERAFIPGLDFVPFIPTDMLPWEIKIVHRGVELPRQQREVAFDIAYDKLALLSDEAFIDVLLSWGNSEERIKHILKEIYRQLDDSDEASEWSPPVMCSAMVYDLSALGPVIQQVTNPCHLIFRCVDCTAGRFELEKIREFKEPAYNFEQTAEKLDAAFIRTAERVPALHWPVGRFIAQAYARMPVSFFKNPPFSLREHLFLSSEIGVFEVPDGLYVWPVDRLHPAVERLLNISRMMGALQSASLFDLDEEEDETPGPDEMGLRSFIQSAVHDLSESLQSEFEVLVEFLADHDLLSDDAESDMESGEEGGDDDDDVIRFPSS